MAEAVMAVAAVVAAGASIYSASEQRKAGKYSQAVAEQEAEGARRKAAYDEEQHRDRVRKILSSQRALYGKSGLEMSGSPLLVLEETAGQGELDALAIRYGGDVEQARARSAGRLYRMQGRRESTASYAQAGSTLLTGAGNYIKSSGTTS